MGRWAIRAMLVVLVLAWATPAAAQRTTGTIAGIVSDATGAVLPGVTVTLHSDAVPGAPTTVTSETGGYRFVGLPPGTYKVTFEVSGFHDAEPGRHRGQCRRDGGAQSAAQGEHARRIDHRKRRVAGRQHRVHAGEHELQPRARGEHPAAPVHVLRSDQPGARRAACDADRAPDRVALGSNTTDNSYQLDGTDFTAPSTGAAWPWPNTDAIEEVEVLQLGASAEYGNVQGAVFNVVTRQGGNAFRGDGNVYYQHQNLTGRNTTDEVDDGLPYNRDRFIDSTWQLGGPIKKDKLWFFGSYQYQRDYESQPGTPPEFPAKFEAKRVFGKLNYQINNAQKLMFAISRRLLPHSRPGDRADRADHDHRRKRPQSVAERVCGRTSSRRRRCVEARYSGFYGVDHGDPLEPNEPRVRPRFNDLDSGQITGGIYSWYDGNSWKTGVQREGDALRRTFPRRQPRPEARRPVQQRRQRLHPRAERLHLHLQRRAGLRLHAAALAPGRADELVRRVRSTIRTAWDRG